MSQWTQPMSKSKTILIGVGILLLCAVGVRGCTWVGGWTYSEGERTGTITKFSHRGMAIKTWEGELSMGGLDQGGHASTWAFSVEDPAVIEKIHASQRKGGRWTLKYREQLMQQSWRGSTSYFVTDVVNATERD